MIISLRPERVTGAVERTAEIARPLDAPTVAVFAATLSAIGAARPSLWFDEAATISASTRSIPEWWRMLANIDAVHGLYYLLMHGWYAVFPATEFWSRVSSSLAVGIAAAGVVALGKQLSTRPVALTAGALFAILPRVTWAGMETRSYALSIAVAVWLTVYCLTAARRDRPWGWVGYAVLGVAAALLNVFLVLLVPVHAVVVAALTRSRRTLAHWAAAATGIVAAVTPFLWFAQGQLFQVGWISPLSGQTVAKILKDQYFDHSVPFAVLSGLVVLGGAVAWRRVATMQAAHPARLVVVTAAWIVVPTAALLAYSALRHPVYYPRYLSFTAPAICLLLGLLIVGIARSRMVIVTVVAAFAATAVPNYLAQRGPYAKEGMDYSQVADVIGRHAAPGDCLIMDNSTTWKPGPIRPLKAARPGAYQTLHDYGRGRSAVQRNMLWDAHLPVWIWADKMPDCPVLWTVSQRDSTLPDHQRGSALPAGPRLRRAMAYQVPSRFGFRVVERWQFSFAQVTKSIR